MTKFVAIVSAKGGVGKTTTSINLSSALDWFRRDVITLDANFMNPDVGIHLGAELMDKTLHSALRGEHPISESIYFHPSGLKIIPGNISYHEANRIQKHNLQNVLLDLVGNCEVVIIDSSPGIGDDVREILKAVDYVIIVTTPDICSVSNSLKMVKLAEEMQKRILGIIVTRVSGHHSELAKENINTLLRNRIIGWIPNDDNIKESLSHKNPVVTIAPDSPASIAFKKVAAELIGERYVEHIEKKDKDSLFNTALKALGLR